MTTLLRAALIGALTGTVVLGIGGRILMRVAALISGRAPAAVTFVGIGLVSSVAQGAVASLPAAPRAVVLALFLALCVACGVVTDRGARRWAGA